MRSVLHSFRRWLGTAPLLLTALLLSGCGKADLRPKSTTLGLTGAASRFTVVGSTLYAPDDQQVRQYDLGTVPGTAAPVALPAASLQLGTLSILYPLSGGVLAGSTTGFYPLDISAPPRLTALGSYTQTTSCTPYTQMGRWAYFAQNGGGSCSPGLNQLQVVDMQNLAQPTLVQTYPLINPLGLSAAGSYLFVCDDGLKVFDTSQAPTLTLLDTFLVSAYAVSAQGTELLVLGDGGVYQYRYEATTRTLRLLSVIPVTP